MRADTISTEAFRFHAYDADGTAIYHSGTYSNLIEMFSVAEQIARNFPACAAMVAEHRPAGKSRFVQLHIPESQIEATK